MLSLGSCEACGWLDLRLLISNQNHGSLGLLHSVSHKYDNSLIILYLCHDMKLGQRNKVLQIRVLGGPKPISAGLFLPRVLCSFRTCLCCLACPLRGIETFPGIGSGSALIVCLRYQFIILWSSLRGCLEDVSMGVGSAYHPLL